jgi:glycosyltransferase involved in cell wall biosynthesis
MSPAVPPSDLPLISIGLPIYNEARFIDATLASLRAQDYPNLEIIVSDNASTDGTYAICEAHAHTDPRLRLERAASNRGATENFLHVLDQARGDFFMWAGGHDLWTPNLVSACLERLRSHPQADLAYASSCWIDADAKPLARESGYADTRGLAPLARFFTVFWGNMHPIMGLMRRRAILECGSMPAIVGGDLVLLSRLALRSEFLHAEGAIWYRREFRVERDHADKLRRYASAETRIGTGTLTRRFPLVALPLALVRSVLAADLPALDKLVALLALPAAFVARYRVGRQRVPDA